MIDEAQRWSHREFWGTAVVTGPVYAWFLLEVAGDTDVDQILGWTMLAVVLALALGALSSDLRSVMCGFALGIVASFSTLAVLFMVAMSHIGS